MTETEWQIVLWLEEQRKALAEEVGQAVYVEPPQEHEREHEGEVEVPTEPRGVWEFAL